MRNSVEALEKEHVGKLLIRISLPAILGLVVQSLYNIIDTIYVGHAIGGIGIAGMTVVYPIQISIIGLANLFSIGGAALISIALGKGDKQEARKIASTVMCFTVIVSVILSIVCQIFSRNLSFIFGANAQVAEYSMAYTSIMYPGIIVTMALMTYYAFLRSEGKQKIVMYTSITSVVLNVILAPLFLWGIKLGMHGVSLATLLSQIVALIVVLKYYRSGKVAVRIIGKYFKVYPKIIYKSMMLGLSSFLQMIGNSIISILVNHFAAQYGGSFGLASYGLAYRVIVILFMPILGFMQGGQPIIGYAWGQKNYGRVREALNKMYQYGMIISIVFCVLSILFAREITMLFGSNPIMMKDTPYYIKALAFALPLMCFQAISASYFQYTGNVWKSTITTIFRQYICYIPVIFIFSTVWGMQGFIYSYTVSNVISGVFIIILMTREYKNKLKKV
ncbi:MAG: MATE family efflux transporter [Fusobacteria bacterium]|nr:MATE family efflux transporter [Fusobacteriota bacterium]